jgi:tetratricopeptide (TPR) repeat protein
MTAPEPPADTAGRQPLSPLEGGRWRPVRPDELLKREATPQNANPDADKPKVPLERRQELERFIRNRPADMDAYLELAAIYRAQGRSVESTRVLKIANEIEPSHAEVLWQLEESALARALQQLKDVRDVATRVNTAEAHRELERAQTDWACRRADVCRARIARDPKSEHLRVVLAEALRDLGEYREACETLATVLHNDAEAPVAYLILGHCYHALGEELAALSAWRHAALRRAVPAPAKVRLTAMKASMDLAQRLGLLHSLSLYQQAWKQAEHEASQEGSSPLPNVPFGMMEAPPNPPPASSTKHGEVR